MTPIPGTYRLLNTIQHLQGRNQIIGKILLEAKISCENEILEVFNHNLSLEIIFDWI